MNRRFSWISAGWLTAVVALAAGAALAGRMLYGPPPSAEPSADPSADPSHPFVAGEPAVSGPPSAMPVGAGFSSIGLDDLDCEVPFKTVSSAMSGNRLLLELRRDDLDTDVESALVRLGFPWAHPGSQPMSFDQRLRRPPAMLHAGVEQWLRLLPDGMPSDYHGDIRPGIDLAHYRGERRNELVFIRWPGTDRMPVGIDMDDALQIVGGDRAVLQSGSYRVIFGPPRVGHVDSEGTRLDAADWGAYGDGIAISLPSAVRDEPEHAGLEPDWRLVPAGGQPAGPDYGFYLSRHPVTQADFVRFLNDAEAHSATLRGTNMVFDADGNVWINPAMQMGRDEMFRIDDSRLAYHAGAPLGERYRVTPEPEAVGGSYSNHPITGVAWFGALKYCNWLTLASGRDSDALSYREGPDPLDWAPVTSHPTNWANGRFTAAERRAWLDYTGIRLPMDDSTGAVSRASAFNEYYKATAWTGVTNVSYGFGRDQVDPLDANYDQTAVRDTTPVGFFDGVNEISGQTTHSNDNRFGIYDLSGNVSEWLSCPPGPDTPFERNLRGGGWGTAIPTTGERWSAPPYQTASFGGFRVLTMAADQDMHVVRIPYHLCSPRLAPEIPPEAPLPEVSPPPDPFADIPVLEPPDIRYRDPPTPPTPPTPPVPPVPPTPPGPPPPLPPVPPPSPSLT